MNGLDAVVVLALRRTELRTRVIRLAIVRGVAGESTLPVGPVSELKMSWPRGVGGLGCMSPRLKLS